MDIQKKSLIVVGLLFVFFSVGVSAQAASLYLSPSSVSYIAGESFNVDVYVSSSDMAMNAASGVISFPKEKLEVISISKTGTVVSLWVQEPAFSNSAGTVNFEGIVLNPGFSGSAGKIISVRFKTKAVGSAPVSFSSGSVLANDGQGTNILLTLGTANYRIEAKITGPGAGESTTPAITAGTPVGPQIISPTHPNPVEWYSKSTAKFRWNVPDDVTDVKLSINKRPVAVPAVLYTKPIAEKTIKDLDDGVWYFHIQMKNKFGWGAVTHFKVQIDTKSPQTTEITLPDGEKTYDPYPTIVMEYSDSVSGMSKQCEVKIDNGEWFKVDYGEVDKKNIFHTFKLPLQSLGKHVFLARVFDVAGNFSTASKEFEIMPIDAPIITDYPSELGVREALVIKGETYSNSVVLVLLEDEKGKTLFQEVKSDQNGDFSLVWDKKLRGGIYKFNVVVTDEQGAKSNPTDTFVISAKQLPFLGISLIVINYLTITIVSIGFVLFTIFMIYYGRYKIKLLKSRLRKETKDIDMGVNKVFELLREDVKNHVKILKKAQVKRELTKEERKILKELLRHFSDSEKFLKKEINDVKKVIK